MRPIHRVATVWLALQLVACAGLGTYADPPRVSLTSIEALDMTLFEQRYRLGLRIQNPNDHALPIRAMTYEVDLNGRKFAHGLSAQSLTVPAFGEEVVEVEVVSNLLRVIEQVRGLESEQAPQLSWRVSGDLRLRDRTSKLPFEYAGALQLAPR